MPETKRLLLLTYYWPPAAGAGVQRWLKMVKYLTDLGWQCTIYCPSNAPYAQRDESLARDLPPGVRTIGTHALDAGHLLAQSGIGGRKGGHAPVDSGSVKSQRGVVKWLRANLFIPDAKMLWIAPSARYLRRWLMDNPQDLLISTGPPHTMHLIARRLKRSTGIPWLADFRDPWVNIDYMHHLPLTAWARRAHERQERSVLLEADAVTVVTPGWLADYQAIRPHGIHLVPNGYDPADFEHLLPYRPTLPLTLLHIGQLNADRNPHTLWEALALLHAQGRISTELLRVRLIGAVDESIKREAEQRGIAAYLDHQPPLPHSAVPQELRSSGALLLAINDTPTAKSILTGKVYEYLAAGRPIICLGPKDGSAAHLLEETRSGHTFGRDDAQRLAQHLLDLLAQLRGGRLEVEQRGVELYSRASQAADIATIASAISATDAR